MPRSADILEQLRLRPAMYTGEQTLSSIQHFLAGYDFALFQRDIEDAADPLILPRAFHGWVAYRLHYGQTSSGWCRMIYGRTTSEQEAIDLFFRFLREFRERRPHLVAKLTGFQKTYTTYTIQERDGERIKGPAVELAYPESISLVTYTDDPGFFAYSDTADPLPHAGYFADLESFEFAIGATRSQLTIVDPNWDPQPFEPEQDESTFE